MISTTTAVKPVKVCIAGINGRMGRASARAIALDESLVLTGAFGRPGGSYVGKDIAELSPLTTSFSPGDKLGILVSNGFLDALAGAAPDVLLDFTHAEVAVENAKAALQRGIRPVIGTSGMTQEHVKELSTLATAKNLGAMIVPNFSVGAVLMMEFARQAAAMFENVEIIEMHHTGKKDAPSGTAMHTVGKIAKSGQQFNKIEIEEKELLRGARGGVGEAGVRVHSLRLPGLISHQEVIFGGDGELLTLRHDSFNTNCFIKGILLALKSVINLDRLVLGLDAVLPPGSIT
jgi:4-hydroxy-tetrahydrodipicolinate reductase